MCEYEDRISTLEDQVRELRELLHGPMLYGMYPTSGGLVDRVDELERYLALGQEQ